MTNIDAQYKALISRILSSGHDIKRRNGKARLVHGASFNIGSAPIVTTRKTFIRGALLEMEWFLNGGGHISSCPSEIKHWWEPFTDEHGRLPHSYHSQFQSLSYWNGRFSQPDFGNQVEALIKGIVDDPYSSRHRIGTWNKLEMDQATIGNCHGNHIQFTMMDEKLHIYAVQGSCDVICGLPHNLIQYWAFFMWICHRSGQKMGGMNYNTVNTHIYKDHLDVAGKVAVSSRVEPSSPLFEYNPSVRQFRADDFSWSNVDEPLVTDKVKMVP